MPRNLISTLMMPTEGVCMTTLTNFQSLTVRTYTPANYEPNYAYPLIVLLHGHGGSDQSILRMAPRISRRNHIIVSVRGPVLMNATDDDGLPTYGWGVNGEHDEFIQNYVIKAIEQTRNDFHVHSERIYLAGIHEGASVAYRLGTQMPEKFGGVIAINGTLPRPSEGPLFRNDLAGLRVMIAHGAANEVTPLELARRDYLALYGAGCDVTLNTYPSTHRVHQNMLRDLNRWVVDNINRDACWEYAEEEVV
jgi:phospholipase/carboxylesterase